MLPGKSSSVFDESPDEMAVIQRHMQKQLDALLLGQGRLESAIANVLCMSSRSGLSSAQDVLSAAAPKHHFFDEATHGMPDVSDEKPSSPKSQESFSPLHMLGQASHNMGQALVDLAGRDALQEEEEVPTAGEDDFGDDEDNALAEVLPSDTNRTSQQSNRTSQQSKMDRFESMTDAEVIAERTKNRDVGALIGKAVKNSEATLARRKHRLHKILKTNEALEEEENERLERERIRKSLSLCKRVTTLSAKDFESVLDSAMGAIIVMNTLFIGFSLDFAQGQWNAWVVADLMFSWLFFCEFIAKIILHRGCGHFCGPDKFSNMFDTTIILIDTASISITVLALTGHVSPDDGLATLDTGYVSLLRVLRLMRILRVLRLLRSERTKTLEDMMQGLLGGVGTLGYAVVLLALMVYITAVVCRVFFGDSAAEGVAQVHPQFQSVPRSMVTIFRCAFGDCANDEGTPLAGLIMEHYGFLYIFGFGGFVFFVTVGFFNIVSAIFVDSTMSASAEQALQKKKNRLENYNLWAKNCSTILRALMSALPAQFGSEGNKTDTAFLQHVIDVEFTRDMVDHAVHHDEDVKDALEALDIDRNDHARLSDILDPDHSGGIGVLELVDGLRRLRGEPRRSDVVAVDLMMRSLQDKCEAVLEEVLLLVKSHEESHRVIEETYRLTKLNERYAAWV